MAKDTTQHVNHNGGYNIKVREVENGFTIHYTELHPHHPHHGETHKNLIARDDKEVLELSTKLHNEWAEANLGKVKENG